MHFVVGKTRLSKRIKSFISNVMGTLLFLRLISIMITLEIIKKSCIAILKNLHHSGQY